MRRLVALDLPGGEAFVAAVRRAHDQGDAVFPLDRRLPDAARRRLLEAMAPSVLLDDAGEHLLSGGVPTEEGDAFVVATSGTTGNPKGVVLTHEAVAASAVATSQRLAVQPDRDRWLACLPLAHVGGLSVIARALHTGTPLEVHDGFSPDAVLDAAARGATLVSLVATALYRLGDAAAAFRQIVLGGSAPPSTLPANATCTYGLTETGSGVVYDGLPLEGVEVAIGEGGEIALRGPMLLRAYRDGTDPKDAAGWLETHDAGAIDDSGRLEVFGRVDECVISGGEKIWPLAVEAVLGTHQGVREAAVAGLPDAEWGARLVAVVVPAPGATVGLEELRELVRAELGAIYAPKQLYVVSQLPRTSIGKLARAEIAKLADEAARN